MLKTTLKSVALLSLVAGIYGLTGCTVDDESSSEESDAEEITISIDGSNSTITNSSVYELIISGNHNTLSLEDNLNDITISGDSNILTVQEDSQLNSITITGSSNIILDNTLYNVKNIIITGGLNIINSGSYDNLTDAQPSDSATPNTVNGVGPDSSSN